eukprot:CAMPEP_0204908798 /NCGR_PEP_ID=MMETSP1397-20131031/7681_1 /ASSEMBLY_ACC=CAM_ASM_000891 /TAXON_ID=49980 /ORGANISM="Climacostomum Climacostomum virens, Strain Stock W-24" /LENGTH=131 /DNA_ID=CAMNT_0052078447 /DNA_START=56 /DNA_END=448 /DNA_ORIENTATION=-
MGEFFASRYIDVPLKEKKFDEYYDHFFNNKLEPTLKRIKHLVYQCSHDCVQEYKLEEACLYRCTMVQEEFIDHLSSIFSNRLATFPACMERCRPQRNTEVCVDECTEVTIKLLDNIDIQREFNTFIDSGVW